MRFLLLSTCLVSSVCVAEASRAQGTTSSAAPVASSAPPPPATKLEAFKPAAGSLVTFGYNELGKIAGVSIDARELRDARGNIVRGVVVEVSQSQYRDETAFIDADELPELLRGIDALLALNANPTSFENFEVRYTTRGELQITAFSSSSRRAISYLIRAGRITKAQVFTDADGLRRLRAMFETAGQQLTAHSTPK